MQVEDGNCRLRPQTDQNLRNDIISQAVTQKLRLPLGGCRAKRHNEAKDREKEGLIITWRTLGTFPKAVSPQTAKLGKF